jgi:hypothetical protein
LSPDVALLGVVAHELCHAWFGNLVGAATAEHLWINEGFAVYAERRLAEQLDGAAAARLQAAIGRRELTRALPAFAARPELTRLRTQLDGLDPDEALSIVPYEKGHLFLCALEQHLGRARFDAWLRAWLDDRAGRVVTSDDVAATVARVAPEFAVDEWLNQSGLPGHAALAPAAGTPESPASGTAESPTSSTAESPASSTAESPASGAAESSTSDAAESSTSGAADATTDALPARADAATWSPWQWRWYLDGLARPSSLCATLDQWFNLCAAENAEVRAAWLPLAIESDYAPAFDEIEAALDGANERGGARIKFLRPLYLALARNPATRGRVGAWWRRFRDGYHPVARQQLDRLLREQGIATQDVNPLSLRRRT